MSLGRMARQKSPRENLLQKINSPQVPVGEVHGHLALTLKITEDDVVILEPVGLQTL